MAALRSFWLTLALLWLASVACAQGASGAAAPVLSAARVVIVSSDGALAYLEAARALTERLERSGVLPSDIATVLAADLPRRLANSALVPPQIYVALGSEATTALAAGSVRAPVLSALLPGSSFERILRSSGRSQSSRFTAIYLDQPLGRQLSLVRLALPQARRVGVLLGPDSANKAAALRALAAAHGLGLHEALVKAADDLPEAVLHMLADCEVFLALADPLVFNRSSIQNILLSSFRARIPMLAFSPAYVRAGSVLALYTTPQQTGSQAADLVLGVLQGKPLPAQGIEPNDFEVGVNPQVAQALGLAPDASALRQALRRQERLP